MILNSTGTNPSIQKQKKVEQIDNRIADIELDFPTQRLYRLNFRPDNSIIQLNNSFANGQYQLYNVYHLQILCWDKH